jgi:hypothetical protein
MTGERDVLNLYSRLICFDSVSPVIEQISTCQWQVLAIIFSVI